jgi:hypothetical protein
MANSIYEGLDTRDLQSVERILAWMHNLNDKKRASVFEALVDNFCPLCGRTQPTDGDHCGCVAESRSS